MEDTLGLIFNEKIEFLLCIFLSCAIILYYGSLDLFKKYKSEEDLNIYYKKAKKRG